MSEGSTKSYKIKLATKPSASVTVTVARKTTGTQDSDISVKTGSSLTFTTSNWNSDQTVTLRAAQDQDGDNGTAVIKHSAAGGGYGSVTAELTATESDDDTKGFTLSSPSGVTVSEGSTKSYKLKLATKPSASVTVTVARKTTGTQDSDISVKTGSSLTFTTSNWNSDQTITLQADEDHDAENGTAVIKHSASGGGYGSVTAELTATESDDDTKGFTLSSPSGVTVTEGSTKDYKLKLTTKPSDDVTVTVARKTTGSQDSDISVKTGGSLTFSTTNWSTDQTVTLEAAEDHDGDNGTAVIEHTASGGGYGSVTAELTATESDNDTKAITLSSPSGVTVTEGSTASYKVKLATKPSASVTVTVARKSGNNQDTNLSVKTGSSLTFTTSNWNSDQTVTLQAAQDPDGENGTAVFTHTASGGGYNGVGRELTATEADDDTKAITLTPSTGVTVSEGSTASYKVKLATKPSASVTVTVTRKSGNEQDSDISVKTGSSLTFTTSNWNSDQTVTLEADEDHDGDDGTAVIEHSASGGGYGSVTAELTATESDDDTRGFTLSSPSGVSVTEGSTTDYKLKLATKPSDDVTVTVARKTTGTQDSDISVKTGSSLTFTTSNWNSDQTVTLQAAEDHDGENGTAVIKHSASGGGYGSVTAELTATESDNDTRGFTLNPTSVTVTEGSTASYKIKLTTKPSEAVTVTVARKSGSDQDSDISVKTGSSLTFTASNWSSDQTVTLQAAEDHDADNGTAVIEHTASGGGYGSTTAELTATESDDDTRGLALDPTSVTVTEGSTASYKVKLTTRPSANVTVTVARKSGNEQDSDISVKTGSSLIFTTSNWNTGQTVTLQAAQDDDGDDGAAVFTHTASGGGYNDVSTELTATENDNDIKAITLSSPSGVTVAEGSTADYKVRLAVKPTSDVTVTVARKTGNDQDTDLSVKTGASLTFTTSNWKTDQTVTLQAAQDDDGENGTAVITHSASGGGYDGVGRELTATESDDDTRGFTLNPTSVTVAEGSTADYKVRLATRPSASVTVTVARETTGYQDSDLSVKTGASLTFTTSNWDTDQTVTLQAAADPDGIDGTAVFNHTASGGGYGNVTATLTATESDTDPAPGPTVAPSSVSLTEGGSTGSYTVKLAHRPASNVTVTVSSQDPGAVTASPASLTFTAENYSTAGTVTLTPVGDADDADESVTITNTASGGGYGDSANVTATVTDDGGNAKARINQVNKEVVPDVMAVASAATQVPIATRIDQAASGALPVQLPGFGPAARQLPDRASQERFEEPRDVWRTHDPFEVVRRFSGQSLTLRAADDDSQEAPGGIGVWGSVDYRSLSGDDDDTLDWKGDVAAVFVGADTRVREDLMLGLQISRDWATLDYTERSGATPRTGEIRTRVTSVAPYAGWFPSEGLRLWGTVGLGRGTLEIDDEISGRETTDLTRVSPAGGATRELASSDKLLPGGETTLTLQGSGSMTWARIADNGSEIDALAVRMGLVRMKLDGGYTRRLASGGVFAPSVQFGLRYDGGDGQTGAGVEVGGTLRYLKPETGLTVVGRSRTLLLAGDRKDWGVGGLVRLDPGANRRGLSLSLAPGWGRTDSSVDRLWKQGAKDMAADDDGDGARGRINTEIGYGLPAPGVRGTLTPVTGLSRAEGSRTWSAGVRFENPALNLSLEGRRVDRDAERPVHGVNLQLHLRF